MTRAPGELAPVLHTHIPWVAGHGTWPVGEEWLFQAWGEAWYPVTDMLLRLAEDGFRDVLTLGVTPAVAAQVADRRLRDDMGTWLAGQAWRAEEQRQARHLPSELRALGPFHWRHHARLLAVHEAVEAAGGLLAVWRDLADRDVIEILGGPASHAYLPLVGDPRLVDALLAAGQAAHERWLGRRPSGLWPPELGYRPHAGIGDPTAVPVAVDRHGTPSLPRSTAVVPGLETHYARHGVGHVLVDAPTLVRAAGGRDRDWTVRPTIAPAGRDHPDDVVHDGVLVGDSDVVAYARDLSVAYHVWSPTAGYPGHADYRDFFARGSFGIHPSWRVTGRDVDVMAKDVYDPAATDAVVAAHVDHFHGVLHEVLDPRPGGLVVAAYDTELYGHWWFEGPRWLEGVLRRVAADPDLTTTTLASRRHRRPPTRRLMLPESSWGYAKGHASWVTPETRWMWQEVRRGEAALASVLASLAVDTPPPAVAAAIEAWCQLVASDWPFMVTRGNTPDYAADRVRVHAGDLDAMLAAGGGAGGPTAGAATTPASTMPVDVDAFLAGFREHAHGIGD